MKYWISLRTIFTIKHYIPPQKNNAILFPILVRSFLFLVILPSRLDNLVSISATLVLWFVFLTRLLTSGILFSTLFNAVFVAKLLISAISFSTVVNAVFVAKFLMSGILFSTVVNPAFVAKFLTLGILFPTVVKSVFVAKLLISGILTSISVILVF